LAYILNIETSSTVCSVSVAKNGELLTLKEINNGFTHAENLHVFIEEILTESSLNINQLNAIAISKGPGSYTGLRIGVSAAKGFAFGLNIPLIALNTLQIMTFGALAFFGDEEVIYCPMIDARRMEVYTSIYNHKLEQLTKTEALIVDEKSIIQFDAFDKIYFFGDGMPKCKTLLKEIKNAHFIENILPSAKNMSLLSFNKFKENQFEDIAYFEPFYLKDFLILSKK
jgi:tRNA threonylcarbamoyladenosine biosynthesis protein TsaB